MGGARNMAIDHALLAVARERGEGVFRTYAWDRPTISFGRHESVLTRFSDEAIRAAGLDAVRRPTGGRALLHAAEVTYSVTMPLDESTAWTVAYAAVNAVLAAALRSLGVDAVLVADVESEPVRPDGPVCFEQPAVGEIAVGGRKLVGSAVWRERGAYLQHGSILIEDQQAMLLRAMRPTPNQVPVEIPAAAALSQLLSPSPTPVRIAEALEAALRDAVAFVGHAPPRMSELELDEPLVLRHEVRYRDPAWLWRR
jgi:lipoate-protein ligase A